MKNRFKSILTVLLALAGITEVSSLDTISVFRYFSENEINEVWLTTDFDLLLSNRFDDFYIPGKLQFYLEDEEIQWDVEVRVRGNSRRKACNIPPLKIRFSPSVLEQFKSFKTLKLVYCEGDPGFDDQFVLKEFLVYRMLNEITEFSYHTHLLRIHRRDMNSNIVSGFNYGFLVEHEDEFAERMNSRHISSKISTLPKLDKEAMATVTVFQYLIGNADWSLGRRHNVSFLDPPGKFPVPVPFDFDYSAIVNASYSSPEKNVSRAGVRINVGPCLDRTESLRAYFKILSKRNDLIKLVENSEFLNLENKEEMKFFVNDFFARVRNEDAALSIFTRNCH